MSEEMYLFREKCEQEEIYIDFNGSPYIHNFLNVMLGIPIMAVINDAQRL
jgi:hypothetical protein